MPARRRFVLTVFVLPIWVLIFALCPTLTRAQTPKSADVRVTVEKERISLYDLLNEVNAQTARAADGKPVVMLRVDPDDAAAATPVAVFVKEMRLPVFADALAATLTIRKAAWRWIPGDGPPSKDDDEKAVKTEDFKPGGIYTLRPNGAARIFAARLRPQILNDLLNEAQEAADGKILPDGVKASAVASPNASAESKAIIEKMNAENRQKATRAMAALRGFSRLSAAQRETLLGGGEIEMELGELPTASATLLQEYLTAHAVTTQVPRLDNNNRPVLKPDGDVEMVEPAPNGPPHVFLQFSLTRGGHDLVPRLTTWGYSEQEYGGKPGSPNYRKVSGGSGLLDIGRVTEARWRDRLRRDWEGAAAPEIAPFPDTLALPGVQNPSDDANEAAQPYRERDGVTTALRRLAETGKFPVMIRLSGSTARTSPSPLIFGDRVNLGAARRNLLENGNVLTRWRVPVSGAKEGVLIGVEAPFVWTTAPEHLVSPSYREELLRAAKSDPIGCLPFVNLLDAAKRLTPEALQSLEADFGRTMEDAARWQPLLKLIAQEGTLRRRLMTKEGASFENFPSLVSAIQSSTAGKYFLKSFLQNSPRTETSDSLTDAYLSLEIEENPARRFRTVTLSLRNAHGEDGASNSFEILPPAPAAPPEPPQRTGGPVQP